MVQNGRIMRNACFNMFRYYRNENVTIHVQSCRCLPSNIQCLFIRREVRYSVRANYDLEQQSVCSIMRAMSLCVNGVRFWNSLCDHLKTINNITAFKRKSKNLLFEKYLVV